jgi:hypothetical protein
MCRRGFSRFLCPTLAERNARTAQNAGRSVAAPGKAQGAGGYAAARCLGLDIKSEDGICNFEGAKNRILHREAREIVRKVRSPHWTGPGERRAINVSIDLRDETLALSRAVEHRLQLLARLHNFFANRNSVVRTLHRKPDSTQYSVGIA